ncbi:GerAB/ArcD/ProY family transporter [Alkalihalobacterium elongatum]|uniref:GerAB/ArcD/ProY family transporter n=1 Tax=Alkalihalobacterium elongatum TaxID=2675466 RepID=UPI001C1F41BF|nr:endospore germination permease [Alkalihalobacterium elongatum]
MEYISYRQSVFLISMILPVTGHFLLLQPLFATSGRDGWISILFTVPIGLLFAFVLYRLHTLYPSKTIVEMLEQAFGVILGKILSISILSYFFYMVVITAYALFDFIYVIFLPETPKWAFAISFYIVVIYGMYLGMESIARMAEPLLLIIIVTGITISIAGQPEKNYENLFPLFEYGTTPILLGMLLTAALFGEFILLMMLRLRKEHSKAKSFLFTNMITVLLITWMFISTSISTLAVFGSEQVKDLQYPAQSLVRVVSIGFIERIDIYGIATIVVGCVIRMATFQYILNLGIRQWLVKKNKWGIHIGISFFVLLFSLFLIEDQQQFFEVYLQQIYPVTAFISVGLPLVTWLLLEIKQKETRTMK